MMPWTRQRAIVDHLAVRAGERRRKLAAIRRAMHDWKFATFGNLRSVAWAFAAGAVVSAGSRSTDEHRRGPGLLVKTVNASFLTWRLFGRPGLDGATAGVAQDTPADTEVLEG